MGVWSEELFARVCIYTHTLVMFSAVVNTSPSCLRSPKFNVKRATMLWPTNPATKQLVHSRHSFPIADSQPLPTIPGPPSSRSLCRHMSLTRKDNRRSSFTPKVCRAGRNTWFSFATKKGNYKQSCATFLTLCRIDGSYRRLEISGSLP